MQWRRVTRTALALVVLALAAGCGNGPERRASTYPPGMSWDDRMALEDLRRQIRDAEWDVHLRQLDLQQTRKYELDRGIEAEVVRTHLLDYFEATRKLDEARVASVGAEATLNREKERLQKLSEDYLALLDEVQTRMTEPPPEPEPREPESRLEHGHHRRPTGRGR